LLSFNEFAVLVDIEPINNKDLKSFEFYLYSQTEFSPQVYVAYDVRKYAAEQGIAEEEALKKGMEEKSREFTEKGRELYAKA